MDQNQPDIESLLAPVFGDTASPLRDAISRSYRETISAKARVNRLKEEIEECDRRIDAQEAHSLLLQNEVTHLDSKCRRIEELLEQSQNRIDQIMESSRDQVQEQVIDPAKEALDVTQSTISTLEGLLASSDKLTSIFAKKSRLSVKDHGTQTCSAQPKNLLSKKFLSTLVDSQRKLHQKLAVLDQLKDYSINKTRVPSGFISAKAVEDKRKSNKKLKEEIESLTKELDAKTRAESEAASESLIDLEELGEEDINRTLQQNWPSHELGPSAPDAVPVLPEAAVAIVDSGTGAITTPNHDVSFPADVAVSPEQSQ